MVRGRQEITPNVDVDELNTKFRSRNEGHPKGAAWGAEELPRDFRIWAT